MRNTSLYDYAKETIVSASDTSYKVDDCIEDLLQEIKILEELLESSGKTIEDLQEDNAELKGVIADLQENA